MIVLYYRKVILLTVDYNEVIDRQVKLAWCDKDGQHQSYDSSACDPETFAQAEKRILSVWEDEQEPMAKAGISIAQMPKIVRRQNCNPHGLS